VSVTYFLVRVRQGATALSINDISERTTLPFGSLEEVKQRLLENDRFEDRSEERQKVHTLAMQRGLLPYRDLPPGAELLFQGSSGEHRVMLQGDPVTCLSINRCAPSEFLVLTDWLQDLAPFAILCDSSEEIIDPESLRPRDARSAPAIFGNPGPASGPNEGPLVARWQVEGKLYVSRAPLPAGEGLLAVPTGKGVTVLDAATGSTLWTREVERRHMAVTLAHGVVVLAGNHPEVFGLSVLDGSILWRLPIRGEVFGSGAILPTGAVAIVSRGRKERCQVTVLEPRTGVVVWTTHLGQASSISVAAVTQWLLAGAGNVVSCFDPESGELLGRREIQPQVADRVTFFPAMHDACGLERRCIILHTCGVESWSLPQLLEAETLVRFKFDSRSERCLGLCSKHVVAAGQLLDGGPVVLRVLAPPSFDVLHEIEILGGPAAIADLGRGRCACLVSAPRQDPLLGANREGEAHILIFETSTGRILHEEPLGSRSWYPGHLAAGDGRLYATYSLPDRRGGAFLRAYDVRQEGEAPDRR